ncbi:DUF5937 family protein [Agromyces archimandritae]|uniref:DUF5937 family protein n=1 Tax=Agromyces archimandritae TaxID=2781962 RepID=UPI001FD60743|nr:DUF5937 family protein [Agromyces archimandritae]
MDRNVVEFRLAPDDVSAIRFGLSPGHELAHAVRVLQRPAEHPMQWGWLRAVRGRVPQGAFDTLAVLIGPSGYFPDFLTAEPEWDLDAAGELERLRAASIDGMRVDLGKMLVRTTGARHDAVRGMLADPVVWRARIADAWEAVWAALLTPVWTQLERILRADVAVRSRRIALGGIAAMAAELHPRVSWSADAVRVELAAHREIVDCRGSGLRLVPSVFSGGCSVLTEAPVQPTLFYPAEGVTESWARRTASAAAALAALLGPARAGILLASGEPRTTSRVAADAGLAASTASHHLSVLRDAGLIASRRDGPRVLHLRTPLGEAVIGARL